MLTTYYVHVKMWDNILEWDTSDAWGTVEGLDAYAHGKMRRHSDTLESLRMDVEMTLEGVTDGGW